MTVLRRIVAELAPDAVALGFIVAASLGLAGLLLTGPDIPQRPNRPVAVERPAP